MSAQDEQALEPTVSGVIVPAHQRVAEFIQYLSARAEAAGPKRYTEIAYDQIIKIMDAVENGTDEDVWTADEGGVVSGKDFDGIFFRLHSWEPTPSSDRYDAPLDHFISAKVTVLAIDPADKRFKVGEDVILNTGAPLVIMKARALEARNMLPADCVIVKIQARNGDVLKLKEAPKQAIEVKAS